MTLRAVLHNIKKKGLHQTILLAEERCEFRKNPIAFAEKRIAEIAPRGNKALRAECVKSLFPKIYNEAKKKPINHTIILMERGSMSFALQWLCNYLNENTDYELKIHCLGIRQVSDEEYWTNALRYIWDCATATAIFNTTANDLMGHLTLRPETTYIQLWHGCGILKKIGNSKSTSNVGSNSKPSKEYPLNTNYSYVTTASSAQNWIYEEAMDIEPESGIIIPVGISKTDAFFDKDFINAARQKFLKRVPQAADKKVVLYAPTFRGSVGNPYSPNELNLEKMHEALGDDYIFIIKHHQTVKNLPDIPCSVKDIFAYDLTRKSGMNIDELLTVADVFISDYSSLIFEYSLFERPMGFFTYDLEEYNNSRGLYYNLEDILPGPLLRTTEDVIEFIKSTQSGFDMSQVVAFRNKYMSACDGHATERTVALIGTQPACKRNSSNLMPK